MKIKNESIELENTIGNRMRIYKIANSDQFCISINDDCDNDFIFIASEADVISKSINDIVDSYHEL